MTSPHHSNQELDSATRIVMSGRPQPQPGAPVSPSIEVSSTFHAGSGAGYGRYSNSNWSALETAISDLEGGRTLVFPSGMAAITAIFALLPIGAVVVAPRSGYTGTIALLKKLAGQGSVDVRFVDMAVSEEVIPALTGASLLWLESPTNPNMDVVDLPALIVAAKQAGCGVAVDNTLATPLGQLPLALGADIVMHSVTKYIAGHSDILLGSVTVTDDALLSRLEDGRKLSGAIPGPFETWLALRGMRTLAVRYAAAQANTLELAHRLSQHPDVTRVRYPGLASDPFHQRAKSFMTGFGAILSFEIRGDAGVADRTCEASQVITYATSLGGVESLWERRHRWGSESPDVATNLIRLSVGIESVEDLWRDIDQALRYAHR